MLSSSHTQLKDTLARSCFRQESKYVCCVIVLCCLELPKKKKKKKKVFYLSQLPFYNNTSFPTAFSSLPMLRRILLDEKIQLVHGHAAFSVLAHEAILHASVLGLSTCFTDHSLFGFSDASAILTNKLLQVRQKNCKSLMMD